MLALHATLRILVANPEAKAHWIDTEGSFNAARAKAILGSMDAPVSGCLSQLLTGQDGVLDRLSVTPVFALEPDFFDAMYDLRDKNPSVLVIDNIATLFRDGLMGATSQGNVVCWNKGSRQVMRPWSRRWKK